MKEALYYKKLGDGKVNCVLCPKYCIIPEGQYGFCNGRKNIGGTLYTLVYGNPSSICVDPIEKKPLFHFLPGSTSLSIGTFGCNLRCRHCQNWTISGAKPPEEFRETSPEELVEEAIGEGCESISYTYNEPAMFFEYVLDTAKLARKKGIKNVVVTNGFINEAPLKEWTQVIDAANVDLKAFNEGFYTEVCLASLKPVLNTLVTLSESNVWFEITNLIIPTKNDNPKEIRQMCEWIMENIGPKYPLHFTAFYPCYKMMNLPPTSLQILKKAREIARKAGIKYVYLGNIADGDGELTSCPKCRQALVDRKGFLVLSNRLKHSSCPSCEERVPGVWE